MKYSYIRSRKNKYNQHRKLLLFVVAVLVLLVGATATLWQQNIIFQRSSETLAAPGSSGTTSPANKAYGIAAGSSLTNADDQTLNQKLDGMAALGIKWVRVDFDWSVIQPDSSQTFDWSQYDKIVAATQARKINVLGILTYTPAWARSSACSDTAKCFPSDAKQYAAFASAVAQRYDSKGLHYWEIWNEPNNPSFWQPKSSPADYTNLLQQSYTALKQQDPQAYVITGGLSPQATNGTSYSPIDFLSAVYKDGGKGYFDAVGNHPYTFPLSPTNTADHAWNQMAVDTNSLHQIMISNGDSNKKIWITEFGAPTGGPGPVATISNPNLKLQPYVVDQGLQQKIMLDALTLYKSYNWVGPFFWYSYQDAGNTPDTNENFFGLVTYGGQPKLAYATYKNWIRANNSN